MGEVNQLWLGRLKNLAIKRGVETDLIDWRSLDWELTYPELKTQVKEILDTLKPDIEEIIRSNLDKWEAEESENRAEHIKAEEERILSEIKTETHELGSFYQQLNDYVSVLSDSEKIHGLICIGSPSTGKSRQIIGMVDNAVVVSGHITPLSLYKTIYENSDKTIIIDDPTTLLESQDSVGILLQALQTEKTRIVQWLSTYLSKLDMLTKTPFTGKVVIIANSIPKEMEVLLSRCLLRKIAFSFEERAKLLSAFSKQEAIPIEISEYALKLCNKANQDRVNFRLLLKANEFHKKSLDWKEFLMESLEIDEVDKAILEIDSKPLSTSDKIKEFRERTGFCRASWFNRSKNLR